MEKYKITDQTSYCLGISLIIEALNHKPHILKQIILSNNINNNQQLDYLYSLANDNNICIIYDDKTINKLSLKENCYGIGIFDKYTSILETDKHIVLNDFNDFGDLGTILRSAVSFDFKDIILINSNIDYFDPRCIRSSMGSIFHCNIINYDNIDEYIKAYPKQKIYSLNPKADKQLNECEFIKPYTILINHDYYVSNDSYNNFYIKHSSDEEISLAIRSAIILEYAYHLNRKR